MSGRGKLSKKDEFILNSLRESVGLKIYKNKIINCLRCDRKFKSNVNRMCNKCNFDNNNFYVNHDFYNHLEKSGRKKMAKEGIYEEPTYPDLI
jgi:hypothetical protein